jgi:replicative DNA helicase
MSRPPDLAAVPPHDANLERAVLGAVFENPGAFDELQTLLPGEDAFHNPLCRAAYAILKRRSAAGEPLDLPGVARELDGRQDELGGWGALAELVRFSCIPASLAYHAGQLRKLALARRLGYFAEQLAADVRAQADPDDLRAAAEKTLFTLGETATASKPKPCHEVMFAVMDRVDAYGRGERVGLETGFVDLDAVVGGFRPGEFIVLAGRPGMGKSKLAGNIAVNVAQRGQAVALFNLEMSNEEVAERFACAEARVDHFMLRNGRVDQDARDRVQRAAVALQGLPMLWFDRPSLKPSELLSHLRQLKRQHDLQLAVVDHLLLMGNDQKHSSQNDRVGEISRMLKLCAKEVGVPVLGLCQMNRGIESRTEDMPRLSDLRDSGNIEQDADTVLFLHKPRGDDVTPAHKLVVAKQRNGPTTLLHLHDDAKCYRFTNYAGG